MAFDRKVGIFAVTMLAAIGLLVWWWGVLGRTAATTFASASQGEGPATPQPGDREWPRAAPPPAADPAQDPVEDCDAGRIELANRAAEVQGGCTRVFARRGVCLPPVEWPEHPSPAEQVAAARSAIIDCGIAPEDVRLDCEEYPCMVIYTLRALHRQPPACDLTRSLADHDLDADTYVSVGGPAWHGWVPTLLEMPSAEHLQARVRSRFYSRIRSVPQALAASADHEGPAPVRPTCDQVARSLQQLRDPESACDALSQLWGCPAPSGGEVTESEHALYEDVAHDLLDELMASCPHVRADNTMVHCSGLPCMLMVEVDEPDTTKSDAFCDDPRLFQFLEFAGRPRIKMAAVFLDPEDAPEEADLRERYEEERATRGWLMLEAWSEDIEARPER